MRFPDVLFQVIQLRFMALQLALQSLKFSLKKGPACRTFKLLDYEPSQAPPRPSLKMEHPYKYLRQPTNNTIKNITPHVRYPQNNIENHRTNEKPNPHWHTLRLLQGPAHAAGPLASVLPRSQTRKNSSRLTSAAAAQV